MEKHISQHKPNGMTEAEKVRSWNMIERHLTAAPSPFSYTAFLKRTQSKIAGGILAALIVSGGAATAYASNAKPGDLLFPVAIAKEKAQILVTKDRQKKEALRVEFAQKRLREVQELAALIDSNEAYATSSESMIDATPALSDEETKRAKRARHGTAIALRELEATRDTLRRDGRGEATAAIDDIISEVRSVSLETHKERTQRERREKKDTLETGQQSGASRDQFQRREKAQYDDTEREKNDGRIVSPAELKGAQETEAADAPLVAEPHADDSISGSEEVPTDEQNKEVSREDPHIPDTDGTTRDDR